MDSPTQNKTKHKTQKSGHFSISSAQEAFFINLAQYRSLRMNQSKYTHTHTHTHTHSHMHIYIYIYMYIHFIDMKVFCSKIFAF